MKKEKLPPNNYFNFAEVRYVEKGTFQGSEEDCHDASINLGGDYVVISKEVFVRIIDILKTAENL